MKNTHIPKTILIAALLVASSITGMAEDRTKEDRTKEPEWSYSDVMKFLKLEYSDRDQQKRMLKEAREKNRAVKKIKSYGKLTPAEVIAIKWERFDKHPHDWDSIHMFLSDQLREADEKK